MNVCSILNFMFTGKLQKMEVFASIGLTLALVTVVYLVSQNEPDWEVENYKRNTDDDALPVTLIRRTDPWNISTTGTLTIYVTKKCLSVIIKSTKQAKHLDFVTQRLTKKSKDATVNLECTDTGDLVTAARVSNQLNIQLNIHLLTTNGLSFRPVRKVSPSGLIALYGKLYEKLKVQQIYDTLSQIDEQLHALFNSESELCESQNQIVRYIGLCNNFKERASILQKNKFVLIYEREDGFLDSLNTLHVIEAVCSGAVPVIIGNNNFLLFRELIAWEDISISIEYDALAQLRHLTNLSDYQLFNIRRKSSIVCNRHFRMYSSLLGSSIISQAKKYGWCDDFLSTTCPSPPCVMDYLLGLKKTASRKLPPFRALRDHSFPELCK